MSFQAVEIDAGGVGRILDRVRTQLAVGPHERVVELPVLVLPLRRDRHPCGFFRCRSEDWPVAIDDPDLAILLRQALEFRMDLAAERTLVDRKSTRLNSSH